MKRLLCIFLCLCLIPALTGCSRSEAPPATQEPMLPGFDFWEDSPLPDTGQVEGPTIDPWNEHTEVWGTPQSCTVTIGEETVTYSCNIPETKNISNAQPTVYIQCTDDKLIFLGCPDDTYPEPESLELVFEAYLEKIAEAIETARLNMYTDYSFSLDDQEVVEIEGRKMLKVRGTMNYLDQGNPRQWTFLGYATQLSNGTYTYWLATYYTGNDYVGLKRIAENMAKSFTEVD